MKFEYKVHEYPQSSSKILEDELNAFGTDCWELVDLDNEVHGYVRATFKRELQ